jgi:hypothetical protein
VMEKKLKSEESEVKKMEDGKVKIIKVKGL